MVTEPNSTDFATGSPSRSQDRLSRASSEAQARAEDLGGRAAAATDQGRSAAAAGLSAAAGVIDETADEGANRVKRAAQRTATALSSGADYIRDNSVRDMMSDAMDVVKSNPGVALLGAVAIGVLLGRALSSRD